MLGIRQLLYTSGINVSTLILFIRKLNWTIVPATDRFRLFIIQSFIVEFSTPYIYRDNGAIHLILLIDNSASSINKSEAGHKPDILLVLRNQKWQIILCD